MDVESEHNSANNGLKTIQCPACGAAIPLRALGQTVMAACSACGAELDVSQPNIRIISKYKAILDALPLPLGARGTLRGQLYEIIGALQRSQAGYTWLEFLLFNPRIGFRWLIRDQGHWSFAEPIKDISAIVAGGDHLRYDGSRFRLFNRGKAKIERVIGEFYWRATVDSQVEVADYIAPPRMLSKEKSGQETTWSLLHYIEPEEIEAAFKVSPHTPRDVGANQPNPFSAKLHALRSIVFFAVLAAIVIQASTAFFNKSETVPLGQIEAQQIASRDEAVFGPFSLTAAHSLNELEAFSSLDNEWLELDCLLASVETGETYNFSNGFEFYSGADSDGPWSEGERSHTSLLTHIPAGQYTLTVSASNDPFTRFSHPVALSLKHDVTPWRNFWLALGLILLHPAYLLYRQRAFEQARWSDSQFNIYGEG